MLAHLPSYDLCAGNQAWVEIECLACFSMRAFPEVDEAVV